MLRDFYTFAKYSNLCPDIVEDPYVDICAYLQSLLPNTPRIAQWRKERGLIALRGKWEIIYALFLIPRLTYKTSLVSALCTFAIIIDPDIRIVLGRATTIDAEQTLYGIKTSIESNPTLRNAFADRFNFDKWTDSAVTLANRKSGMREPTIDTTGLNTSKTGSHPDMVILDDLVHENNYQSPAIMEVAKTKIQAFTPIIESWGSLIVVGTRWSELDVYGWILEREETRTMAGQSSRWEKFVVGCYKEDGDGGVTFPTVLPELKIASLKDEVNPKLFAAWYLNKARSEGENLFLSSYIQYFDMAEFIGGPFSEIHLAESRENQPLIARFGPRIRVSGVMLIDPAPTVGQYSDFTGVVGVYFDANRNWWVVFADEIKKHPTDRLNHITMLAQQYPPAIVAIENADMQAPLLQERLQEHGISASVVSFNPLLDRRKILSDSKLAPRGRTKKAAQIDNLEPVMRARRVFFCRGATAPLIKQIMGYPQLRHDDVIDAFSMAQAYEKAPETRVDSDPAKVLEALELREFMLEGLNPDGTEIDAPRKPGGWKEGRWGRRNFQA